MALDPLSSDSEFDNPGGTQEYHYESEGEERLANCARTLLREADGDYRLARTSILAYTRSDLTYVPRTPPRNASNRSQGRSTAATPPRTPSRPGLAPWSSSQVLSISAETNNPARTRFVTPPRTPGRTPAPQSPRNGSARPNHNPSPASPITGSQRQSYTLLYSLLRDEKMLDYFPSNDGVSDRPPEVIRDMLRMIKANEYWVGNIDHVNKNDVGDEGAEQTVHEPAANAVSSRWYAITIGLQVGIFSSWDAAYPHCKRAGLTTALYKRYETRGEAYRAYQYSLLLGAVRLLPLPPS